MELWHLFLIIAAIFGARHASPPHSAFICVCFSIGALALCIVQTYKGS